MTLKFNCYLIVINRVNWSLKGRPWEILQKEVQINKVTLILILEKLIWAQI